MEPKGTSLVLGQIQRKHERLKRHYALWKRYYALWKRPREKPAVKYMYTGMSRRHSMQKV